MIIDSSGNLLVGKTNNALANDGVVVRGGGEILATNTSDLSANFNRLSTDGGIVGFYKDGTTVGSIGVVSSNNLKIHSTSSGHSGLSFGTGIVYATDNAGDATNGGTDLGSSSYAWKDIYLSGGAYLGGTGSANHLDDYEEGTWTPTVASGTGGFTGTPEGVYVKVGNIVHVKAVFYVDVNFSNNAIGGLPFTVADDVTASVLGWNGTVVCETASINCSAAESDTVINFFNEGDSGSSHNPSTTGLLYRVSVTYKST
jgi:hypothetical protein